MRDIQAIVNEYFLRHRINIEQVKKNYKNNNKIKLIDDSTAKAYTLGVDDAKLYIEQLMIK